MTEGLSNRMTFFLLKWSEFDAFILTCNFACTFKTIHDLHFFLQDVF